MPQPKTRQDYLDIADEALREASALARRAASAAYGQGRHNETQDHAAAGALWAVVARSAAAVARALPEDAPEDTDA
jgi:SRSO17 transposase